MDLDIPDRVNEPPVILDDTAPPDLPVESYDLLIFPIDRSLASNFQDLTFGELPSTRSGRKRKLPARFREDPPVGPNKLQPPPPILDPTPNSEDIHEAPKVYTPYETVANIFGLFRRYPSQPSDESDVKLAGKDFFDTRHDPVLRDPPPDSAQVSTPLSLPVVPAGQSPIWPFKNVSQLLFLNWFYNGGTSKSLGERNRLVEDVLQDKYFVAREVTVPGLNNVENQLKEANSDPTNPLFTGETWHRASVPISIPRTKSTPVTYEVPGLVYRSITNVVVAALRKKRPPTSALHYMPFRTFWESPTSRYPSHFERVYDELYSSDVWLREHDALQNLPAELNENGTECKLERAIAGLMLWSDATQLASFGTAKLWPIYMFLGNQSKFQRNKGSARECHHIAYIPSVRAFLLPVSMRYESHLVLCAPIDSFQIPSSTS